MGKSKDSLVGSQDSKKNFEKIWFQNKSFTFVSFSSVRYLLLKKMNSLLRKFESTSIHFIKRKQLFNKTNYCKTHARNWSVTKSLQSENAENPTWNTSHTSTSDKLIIHFLGPKGQYKSYKDVPEYVSTSEMDRARAKFRIRVNLFTMVYALICGIYFIKRGQEDAQERRTARAIEDSRI